MAVIQAGIAADPGKPAWTERDFTAAQAVSEALIELGRRRQRRGVIITQQLVSLHVDKKAAERRGRRWIGCAHWWGWTASARQLPASTARQDLINGAISGFRHCRSPQ